MQCIPFPSCSFVVSFCLVLNCVARKDVPRHLDLSRRVVSRLFVLHDAAHPKRCVVAMQLVVFRLAMLPSRAVAGLHV